MTKRPSGITFLCLVLGWLTLAGVANGAILLQGRFGPLLPEWMASIAFAYALTAAASAIGLWKMRKWGLRALRTWMAVVVGFFVCFILVVPEGVVLGGYVGGALFLLFVAAVLYLLDQYVSTRLANAA